MSNQKITFPFDTLVLMLCVGILVVGMALRSHNELKIKGEWYDKGYRAGTNICADKEALNVR